MSNFGGNPYGPSMLPERLAGVGVVSRGDGRGVRVGGEVDGSAAKAGRSPFTDAWPVADSGYFGFTKLTVPAGTAFGTLPIAVYPLLNIDVASVFGQEMALFGWDFDAAPTDSTRVAPDVAWGSATGEGACVVIGRDLDLPAAGTWGGRAFPIAGVGLASGAAAQFSAGVGGAIKSVLRFPPGTYADTVPTRIPRFRKVSPYTYRFPQGSRLCVALCVRASQVENSGGSAIDLYGFCEGNLHLGRTANIDNWSV